MRPLNVKNDYNFPFVSAIVFTLESDVDYPKTNKRVLFSLNNQEEINNTLDVKISTECYTWNAYLRVTIIIIIIIIMIMIIIIPPIRNRISEMQTIETNRYSYLETIASTSICVLVSTCCQQSFPAFQFLQQEKVEDVYPDIKFKLTYKIVEKTPPPLKGPTDVPSLVPYAVLDPTESREATALVGSKCNNNNNQCIVNCLRLLPFSLGTMVNSAGCSLSIRDRRILRLLHRIRQLNFACFLRELCP